jgi:hypothetical protein
VVRSLSRHLRRTMVRESDERLELNELIAQHLTNSRRKNAQLPARAVCSDQI